MGQAKKWAMEQNERGYGYAPGAICGDCVSDAALANWIATNLSSNECQFCEQSSDDPIAADFDDFVGLVLAGIRFDWSDPDDEGIEYETAEGGYQARLTDTWDIFYDCDYTISENDNVVEALIRAINTEAWVKRHYYIGNDSQRLGWGWEAFKTVTKHQTRYLFLRLGEPADDGLSPSRMLDAIAEVIGSAAEGGGLLKSISPSANLFRVRIDPVCFRDAAAIGPPPIQYATQSNRMSPAGIPMFYGAFDKETAIAETFDPKVHSDQIMSIGLFRALHDLTVLDLADLPEVPSVFEPSTSNLIHPLRFLHAFARDIAQPIERDGREHIEYVPTQIATEYFRRVFRTRGGQPIDGLIYRSSKNSAASAFVLFCENEQCVDTGFVGRWNDKLLLLVGVEHLDCPRTTG